MPHKRDRNAAVSLIITKNERYEERNNVNGPGGSAVDGVQD